MSNGQDPLVSVVTATYNRPVLLREAVESALAQTYRNIEVIVCDDSAADANREAVEGLSDSRVRYVPNATRLGGAHNKVKSQQLASGHYLANLDDDDLWEPNLLEVLVGHLEDDPELVVAFADFSLMDSAGRIDVGRSSAFNARVRGRLSHGKLQPFIYEALVDRAVPAAQAAVFRRSRLAVDEYPSDREVNDLFTSYLACRSGGAAYYHPEPLARYREHPGSSTATAGFEWHEMFTNGFEFMLRDERVRVAWPELRRQLGMRRSSMAVDALVVGRRRVACAHAARGVVIRPSARALGVLMLSIGGPRSVAARLRSSDRTPVVGPPRVRAGG